MVSVEKPTSLISQWLFTFLCVRHKPFFFRLLTGMAGVLKFLKDTTNLNFIPQMFKSDRSIPTQNRASYCLFICKTPRKD